MEICRAISLLFCLLSAPAVALSVPEIQYNGDLRFVSGGVGIDERRALEEVAPGFDLKVVLSTESGHLLGGGQIKVRDSRGNLVLNTISDGPVFLLDVPAGSYTIEAVVGDRVQGTRFEANGGAEPQPAYLTWHIEEQYRHYSSLNPDASAAL
ncbi:hypothetical protein [Microbulbifer marinus]|uniref:Carboxypeptidase regulatory-like domain-containing protein n=1 Tax=Microbulbifer marinus TaxID=658218 RepID=A0A1H3VR28_9GAMM|nr:hypothetical protein [Microbulbifer marinus]SDZ76704.1 hypothetical protein SAMN05216562_0149 [Microbulbifer marinus]